MIDLHQFDRLVETMDQGFAGINARLDRLNHRTRMVEISSTTQWVLWGICGAGAMAILQWVLPHLVFAH